MPGRVDGGRILPADLHRNLRQWLRGRSATDPGLEKLRGIRDDSSPRQQGLHIFESKINGEYLCFHRPSGVGLGGHYLWLASSPDLAHWGKHHCLARTRPGMWDSGRIGAGAAPIRTDRGWLAVYHGANEDNRYCLGALLLDLEDPSKVVSRGEDPLMEPLEIYERKGFFGNVVFTNGHLLDGDRLTLYYGASDSVICSAELSVSEILQTL